MLAKMGSKVLMNTPSNCASAPRPMLAPKTPKAGKQAVQPAAATKAPIEPILSARKDKSLIILIFIVLR